MSHGEKKYFGSFFLSFSQFPLSFIVLPWLICFTTLAKTRTDFLCSSYIASGNNDGSSIDDGGGEFMHRTQ